MEETHRVIAKCSGVSPGTGVARLHFQIDLYPVHSFHCAAQLTTPCLTAAHEASAKISVDMGLRHIQLEHLPHLQEMHMFETY
jgi:hypothetical protein